MKDLKEYANTLYQGLECKKIQLTQMQIKVFLETSDEIYDTLVALLPVASNISSNHLAVWSSVVSTIRLIRTSYKTAIKEEAETGHVNWPTQDDICLTLREFLEASYFISNEKVSA